VQIIIFKDNFTLFYIIKIQLFRSYPKAMDEEIKIIEKNYTWEQTRRSLAWNEFTKLNIMRMEQSRNTKHDLSLKDIHNCPSWFQWNICSRCAHGNNQNCLHFGIYDIKFPNKHWLHSNSNKSGVHCTWANTVWKLGPVLFAWAYIRWESPAAALFPRILRRSPTTSFYWSTFVSFWL